VTDDPATTCTLYPPPSADVSPRSFDPAWRTESVLALAKGIETERAFDRLPILADALEEAGCDDEVLLRHCRGCEWHQEECWALRQVLAHFSLGYQPKPGLPVPRAFRERFGVVTAEERKNHRFAIVGFILFAVWVTGILVAARMMANKSPIRPTASEQTAPSPGELLAEKCRSDLQRVLQVRTEWVELAKTHAEVSPVYQTKGKEFWDAIDGMRITAGMCGVTFPERPKVLSHRTAPIIVVPAK
jgi:hypothetical protein